jgi:hypothetical protein
MNVTEAGRAITAPRENGNPHNFPSRAPAGYSMDKTKDQLDRERFEHLYNAPLDDLSFEEFEEYRILCLKYCPNWDGRFKDDNQDS